TLFILLVFYFGQSRRFVPMAKISLSPNLSGFEACQSTTPGSATRAADAGSPPYLTWPARCALQFAHRSRFRGAGPHCHSGICGASLDQRRTGHTLEPVDKPDSPAPARSMVPAAATTEDNMPSISNLFHV